MADEKRTAESAAPFVPESGSLDELKQASKGCRGCDLYENATQTVFGEGAPRALVMLVGEQPGDREDVVGEPFVGPAGGLLDRALAEAGIDRRRTYVTNAVKHFKWEPKGKRRIHMTPRMSEIRACRPWLQAEIGAVQPDLIVAMGSTAVKSLLGPDFKLLANRGEVFPDAQGRLVLVTVHPSAVLRAPDEESRHAQHQAFVRDLRRAAEALQGTAPRRK